MQHGGFILFLGFKLTKVMSSPTSLLGDQMAQQRGQGVLTSLIFGRTGNWTDTLFYILESQLSLCFFFHKRSVSLIWKTLFTSILAGLLVLSLLKIKLAWKVGLKEVYHLRVKVKYSWNWRPKLCIETGNSNSNSNST